MLERRAFLAALAALPQKKPRKADIEVVRISSTRQEGRITYEGVVRSTSARTLQGLVLQFEYFESRGVLLSQQKIQVVEGPLSPGDEKKFQVQGSDVPRAVRFKIQASEAGGRDLTVSGEGPYPLD